MKLRIARKVLKRGGNRSGLTYLRADRRMAALYRLQWRINIDNIPYVAAALMSGETLREVSYWAGKRVKEKHALPE